LIVINNSRQLVNFSLRVKDVIIKVNANLVEFNIVLIIEDVIMFKLFFYRRDAETQRKPFIILTRRRRVTKKTLRLRASAMNKFLFLSIIRTSFMNTQLEIHHVCKANH